MIAEEQTAGRGRQGRTWSRRPGRALTLSVARAHGAARRSSCCRCAVALAVCEACEAVAPRALRGSSGPTTSGSTAARSPGILIEARPQEGWAVVGIGLNVDTAAEELGRRAARDRDVAADRVRRGRSSREPVLDALLERLAELDG